MKGPSTLFCIVEDRGESEETIQGVHVRAIIHIVEYGGTDQACNGDNEKGSDMR